MSQGAEPRRPNLFTPTLSTPIGLRHYTSWLTLHQLSPALTNHRSTRHALCISANITPTKFAGTQTRRIVFSQRARVGSSQVHDCKTNDATKNRPEALSSISSERFLGAASASIAAVGSSRYFCETRRDRHVSMLHAIAQGSRSRGSAARERTEVAQDRRTNSKFSVSSYPRTFEYVLHACKLSETPRFIIQPHNTI